jgi:ribose 5-phosphate isomerase A
MDQAEAKRLAAKAALDLLPESGVVGLGSGSTASLFIEEVGRLVAEGRQLTGVPTSQASAELAQRCGIPLLSDIGPWEVAVCVDGADEVSEALDLIKGGGGCQTREKIVNYSAHCNVIVVDESKLSARLGERWPVPLEVLAFAHQATVHHLSALGRVTLRERGGAPWLTDAGNYLYDLHLGPIADPAAVDTRLRAIPGVVETGLFVGRADVVIVAGATGVRTLRRK